MNSNCARSLPISALVGVMGENAATVWVTTATVWVATATVWVTTDTVWVTPATLWVATDTLRIVTGTQKVTGDITWDTGITMGEVMVQGVAGIDFMNGGRSV